MEFAELVKTVQRSNPGLWTDEILSGLVPDTRDFLKEVEARHKQAIEQLQKEQSFGRLPFLGSGMRVLCGEGEKYMLIECWYGTVKIKVLHYDNTTYSLNIGSPLEFKDVTLYAEYLAGAYQGIFTPDKIGFHHTGFSPSVGMCGICTGELEEFARAEGTNTYESIQETAKKLVKALEIINLDSLGEIMLPSSAFEIKGVDELVDLCEAIKDPEESEFAGRYYDEENDDWDIEQMVHDSDAIKPMF